MKNYTISVRRFMGFFKLEGKKTSFSSVVFLSVSMLFGCTIPHSGPAFSDIEKSGDDIDIRINTVEEVVEMNHKRKDNDLPFYPFNKDMDKYGTVYVSVFYKKKSPTGSYPKEIVDTLIKNVMVKFGADYHYTSVRVRSSVIKWSGI